MTAIVIGVTALTCLAGIAFVWWSMRETRNTYYADYMERKRPEDADNDKVVLKRRRSARRNRGRAQ